MEPGWIKEALFAGQTANGFKLGTAITLGWFWARINGCRIVYRGGSMEEIDFEHILAVVNAETSEIELPDYVPHEPGQVYFYVVRCANRCGRIERTLQAAVKVEIDSEGQLQKPRPNDVFGLSARRRQDGKNEIVWKYCPIEQASGPKEMRIYSDNGTGEIDYREPIATVAYRGRRFYRYENEQPGEGWYRFAVRAMDAVGTEYPSTQTVSVEVQNKAGEAIEIVNVSGV